MYLELKHHAPQLTKIINDQHSRLGDAQKKLLKVEEKQSIIQKRIDRAIQTHNSLEERLQQLRNLPCAHKKPLSRAERQFKSELGNGCLIPYFLVFDCYEILNYFFVLFIFNGLQESYAFRVISSALISSVSLFPSLYPIPVSALSN